MKIPSKITRTAAKTVLKAKQNSPHLFFGAGLGAVGLSTFLACKGTLKVEKVLDDTKANLDDVRGAGPYNTAREESKAVAKVYTHAGVELVKLYGPAVLVGGLGVAALTGAHVQLTRRNTALMGSLAASMRAFAEYRERVAGEIGAEKELDLFRGLENETIKNPDGTKEVVKVRNGKNLSQFARCFDEASWQWQKNAEMNRMFLTVQEQLFNMDLKSKGYVFLNDVYEQLGFERTAVGQNVGWFLNGDGDNYIDFGLHEVRNSDFAVGHERSCWLDFNVDGVISDKLQEI